MAVKSALERELKALPKGLRESALAAGALVVAAALDDDLEAKLPDKAAGLRALQSALDRLRELAPPEEAKDGIDQLAEKRTTRRAGVAKTPRRAPA